MNIRQFIMAWGGLGPKRKKRSLEEKHYRGLAGMLGWPKDDWEVVKEIFKDYKNGDVIETPRGFKRVYRSQGSNGSPIVTQVRTVRK